jgi:hypothetical protein
MSLDNCWNKLKNLAPERTPSVRTMPLKYAQLSCVNGIHDGTKFLAPEVGEK